MRSQYAKTAAVFFSPETLLPFLVGSIFLAVLGSAVWELLFTGFTQLNNGNTLWAAVQLGVGSLVIFLFAVFLFTKGLDRLEPETLADTRTPAPHRGLILLVSNATPCQVAIQYHAPKLERCWLIHSEETKPIAQSLADTYGGQRIEFRLIPVTDIHEPLEYYQHVRRIYSRLPTGWQLQQVMADYTGMTAHGSVGVGIASWALRTPLQYTPRNPNRPNESMQPIEIALRTTTQKRA